MIDLHAHDTFSMRDGYGTPEQIVGDAKGEVVGRLEELGREVVCITNHDNVYSFPFYNKLCENKKIKPIFGCEVRLVHDIRENSRKKFHLTLLSQTVGGYKNLQKLVTAAHTRECQYYFPTIDLKMLKECSEGITCLSGCMSSLLSHYILNDELLEAVKLAKWFKEVFGERYFLEVQPHNMDETQILAPATRAISNKLDIPIVLTNDVHYLRKGQEKIWKILMCIRAGVSFNSYDRNVLDTCYYMEDDEAWNWANEILGDYFTYDEMYQLFSNQEKIASNCVDVTIPRPNNVLCGADNPLELLRQRSYDGLRKLGLEDSAHVDRLERELDMIMRKDFTDYFIIISDMVRYAKEQNVPVGSSRGSVACSLVANCLDITCVDPLEYDLTMERFLSEERVDPPDIDIDFSKSRREEVIEYLRNKFGRGNVAQISTFNKFKGKNTLDYIGKVFNIPPWKVKEVKEVLIERASADARSSATIEDTFEDFTAAKKVAEEYPEILNAVHFEGQISHLGKHAAGVVVSSTPLVDTIATVEKEMEDIGRTQVTSLDAWGIQWLGLLKIDLLGLKNLDMLREMSDDTGIYDIYNLPMEDDKTIEVFRGDTLGVFQFGAPGTASICKQISIDSFEDVTLVNALSRPGPLHTGTTEQISINKRDGTIKFWDIPLVDEITKDTYGYSVFQEQVLRIMHEVGDLCWEDVALIRNAMSKSKGDEFFDTFRAKFIEGSNRLHGISEEDSNHVFDHVSTFGCLSGDTKVTFVSHSGVPYEETIKEAFDWYSKNKDSKDKRINRALPLMAYSLDENGDRLVVNEVLNIVYSGKKKVYELETSHGKTIKATSDHKFLTPTGWKKIEELSWGNCICTRYFSNKGIENRDVKWEMIKRITEIDVEDTYDICMKSPYNSFVANGFIVHNSWAFNKAHAVGYSLISWATAYFKAHHPREFFKTLCNYSEGEELRKFLREYKERGLGEILPPKIGKSQLKWSIEGDHLRAGLESVLTTKSAEAIVEAYPVESREDLLGKVQRRVVNARIWKKIEENHLFDDDDNYDPFGLYVFAERMSHVKERTEKLGDLGYNFNKRKVVVAGVLDRQINEKSLTELEQSSKLKDWRKRFDESAGDQWAIIYLRDETGISQVHIKNYLYPKVKDMIWSKKIGEDILVIDGLIPPSRSYVIAYDIKTWNDRKWENTKCFKCSLIQSDFCPVKMNVGAKVVLLGMCPGENEIDEQKYFVDRAGIVLNKILKDLGIDRDKDLHVTNSVMCRSLDEYGSNRDPNDEEIECCSERLRLELEQVNSKVIVPLGALAYKALTGEESAIGKLVEQKFEHNGRIIVPSYHPSAIFYANGEQRKESIQRSIQYAMELANE